MRYLKIDFCNRGSQKMELSSTGMIFCNQTDLMKYAVGFVRNRIEMYDTYEFTDPNSYVNNNYVTLVMHYSGDQQTKVYVPSMPMDFCPIVHIYNDSEVLLPNTDPYFDNHTQINRIKTSNYIKVITSDETILPILMLYIKDVRCMISSAVNGFEIKTLSLLDATKVAFVCLSLQNVNIKKIIIPETVKFF
jgi:hypothetical protein